MVNGDKTAITIYSKKYSTFAIATTEFLAITFDARTCILHQAEVALHTENIHIGMRFHCIG